MKKVLIFCSVIVVTGVAFALFFTPKTIPFNKTGWNTKGGGSLYYTKREAMLDDLLKSYRLKGMNMTELNELFGANDLEVFEYDHQLIIQMNIVTDHGWNIDPEYTKDLFLYLSKDSVVTSFEVKEYQSK